MVGAYAMAVSGYIRATGDLDIWINPSPGNGKCVFQALKRFGAPLEGVTHSDFSTPGTVFQMGLVPVRIDILTELAGLSFKKAYASSIKTSVLGTSCHVLSLNHLIRNKLATGRDKDKADASQLQEILSKADEKDHKK